MTMSLKNSSCVVVCTMMLLGGCGGGGGGGGDSATPPDPPTDVTVSAGPVVGTTASVAFNPPTWDGGSPITVYTVTADPGGISASGEASPIVLVGLTPGTSYVFTLVAANDEGDSEVATAYNVRKYSVVETFYEPMTQPNDTIFTGSFSYDAINRTVSNLEGSLTQSMTKPDPTCQSGGMGMSAEGTSCYGGPMTTVTLMNQLSSEPVTLGGVEGMLVTTFALTTTDTFDGGGFAPGGTEYFGLSEGAPNPKNGGVGNAYAMIFVSRDDPTAVPAQVHIDKLAYADCTAGGMMMSTCMTGTTAAGYGHVGTMDGYPVSQVITRQ